MVHHKIAPSSRAYNLTLETHKVTTTNDNAPSQTSHITTTPTNATNQTIPNLRPGRRHNRKSTNININININSAYGDSHLVRDKNEIRIFFQNVKGLTYSHTGEDHNYYMMSTQAIGAHRWDGRNQHGMITSSSFRITYLTSTQTFRGHKHFIWISRLDHPPGSRQRNLPIWRIHHHDNGEPCTNVAGGTYQGSNRFGNMERTHPSRKVKSLHPHCIQSLLRINWKTS
jgi:hypothetical protein